jgi:hypothetical protein
MPDAMADGQGCGPLPGGGGPLRLTLDIEPSSDPVRGSIAADGAPSRPFAGWVGLMQALESALATARTAGDAG